MNSTMPIPPKENLFLSEVCRPAVKRSRPVTSARNALRVPGRLCHGSPSQSGAPPYPVRHREKVLGSNTIWIAHPATRAVCGVRTASTLPRSWTR